MVAANITWHYEQKMTDQLHGYTVILAFKCEPFSSRAERPDSKKYLILLFISALLNAMPHIWITQ
jgi:hypothetical protein